MSNRKSVTLDSFEYLRCYNSEGKRKKKTMFFSQSIFRSSNSTRKKVTVLSLYLHEIYFSNTRIFMNISVLFKALNFLKIEINDNYLI